MSRKRPRNKFTMQKIRVENDNKGVKYRSTVNVNISFPSCPNKVHFRVIFLTFLFGTMDGGQAVRPTYKNFRREDEVLVRTLEEKGKAFL